MKKLHIAMVTMVSSIAALWMMTDPALGCTTVLVGKNASTDGSTMIARDEDAHTAWTKRFVVHPQTDNGATTYRSVGNDFTMALPKTQQRYTATPDWTSEDGTYGEDGINQSNVAMSGTESSENNQKAAKADPYVKNGISEDSMLDVVLPFIDSAKDGVLRLGQIVETKGAAESDGIIFSDKNEIWYMEIGSGHEWAAVRVPDNQYAVIPNQMMIGKLNLKDAKNYLSSPNLQGFVKKHQLKSYKNKQVNFSAAFGTNSKSDAQYNRPRVWDGQRILTPSKKQTPQQKHFAMFMKPDKKISRQKVGQVLGLHFNGTKYDSTGKWTKEYRPINVPTNMESHIIQFRQNVPAAISGIQWIALASPDTSVYVPFYTTITDTPAQYKIGTDHYDSQSAAWTYKQTKVLVDPYYNEFVKKYVRPAQATTNQELQANLNASDQKAKSITNPTDLAAYLTASNATQADLAQKNFTTLNAKLMEAATAKTPIKHKANL